MSFEVAPMPHPTDAESGGRKLQADQEAIIRWLQANVSNVNGPITRSMARQIAKQVRRNGPYVNDIQVAYYMHYTLISWGYKVADTDPKKDG